MLMFAVRSTASAIFLSLLSISPAVANCEALAPESSTNVEESFKGALDGRIIGALSRLAGGQTSIDGEYKKIVSDNLSNYPDSQKLYLWQRLIYLSCLKPELGLDINELATRYLAGPPTIEGSGTLPRDLEILFVGLHETETRQSVDIGGLSLSDSDFPHFVFSVENKSEETVYLGNDVTCEFKNFKLQKPVRYRDHTYAPWNEIQITINNTVFLRAIGQTEYKLAPGQKKILSYVISLVDPPSFESDARQHSVCAVGFSVNSIHTPREIELRGTASYL